MRKYIITKETISIWDLKTSDKEPDSSVPDALGATCGAGSRSCRRLNSCTWGACIWTF